MSEYMNADHLREIRSFVLDATWSEEDPVYRYEMRLNMFAWRLGYTALRNRLDVPFYAHDVSWIPVPESWIQEEIPELESSTLPHDEVA